MASRSTISRRVFVVRAAQIAVLAPVVGCKRDPVVCVEGGQLAPEDHAARKAVAYVERALDATRRCGGCRQFTPPPSGDGCGSCKLLKGSIHPEGTCKVFSPR